MLVVPDRVITDRQAGADLWAAVGAPNPDDWSDIVIPPSGDISIFHVGVPDFQNQCYWFINLNGRRVSFILPKLLRQ